MLPRGVTEGRTIEDEREELRAQTREPFKAFIDVSTPPTLTHTKVSDLINLIGSCLRAQKRSRYI